MRWRKQDIQKYVQAKEYIDTAIIPLIPISFPESDEQFTSLVFQKEVVDLLVDRVEQEFVGRVLALPSYTYLHSANREEELNRLQLFTEEINKNPFKFTFFVTFDSTWKKVEKNLEGNLLWMPVMKDGDLQKEDTQKMIMDQVYQITDLIKVFWSE
jgi:hypothetical protein